jgi:two-component system, NarL family, nitrate/nitrite response regulator NarL
MAETLDIRIVIADDHPIFRDGVKRLLQSEPGFHVIGEAGDGAGAVQMCARLRPDILLLDMSMPGAGGLEALQQLASEVPSVRTLMLTAGLDSGSLVTALQLGARGVLLKDSATTKLFESIRSVVQEESAPRNSQEQIAKLLGRGPEKTAEPQPKPANRYSLTPRELEVVVRIVAGESNKEIAQALSLRENTVKHHLSSIFDKLGVFSRLELAVFAMNHGLCGES